jgi:hypothetical protein
MDYDFTNQLERLASNVARNPGNFVTNTTIGGSFTRGNITGGSSSVGFRNIMHFGSINAGALFDFMF